MLLPRRICLLQSMLLLLFLLIPEASTAQTPEPGLTISLRRDFGYGGIGNDIQGLFTIRVSGGDRLAKVEYFLDGNLIGSRTSAPFDFQFRTEDYPIGQHTIYAVGTTTAGIQLRSNDVRPNFVAAEQGWRQTLIILAIVFGLVFGVMIFSGLVTAFSSRGKNKTLELPKSYGMYGAAVCPNCILPFARHWWGINLVVGKLDRCPHCGKWSLVRRATPDELGSAESRLQAHLAPRPPHFRETNSEIDNRELDDSKYID